MQDLVNVRDKFKKKRYANKIRSYQNKLKNWNKILKLWGNSVKTKILKNNLNYINQKILNEKNEP